MPTGAGQGRGCARASAAGKELLFEGADAFGRGVDVVVGEVAVLDVLQDGFHGAGNHLGVVCAAAVVGEAEHVAAGQDGHFEGFGKAVLVGDGAHGQVVGDDDAAETKLFAEFAADGEGREGGGQAVAHLAVDDVGHHDHVCVAFGDEVAVGGQFGFLPGAGDIYEAGMGVARRAAMAGEVFEAGDDAVLALDVEPDAGALGDALGVGREAAAHFADDGAGGVDVDIHAGGEVEVDAGFLELLGDDEGVVGDALVAGFGRGLGGFGGGEAVFGAQARDVASFLVDTDEEAASAVLLEVGAELLYLAGRFDVAVACAGGGVVLEEDDVADVVLLNVADDMACFADSGAAEADEEHFADVLAQLGGGVDGLGLFGFGHFGDCLAAGCGAEAQGEGQDEEAFAVHSMCVRDGYTVNGTRWMMERPRVISSAYSKLSPMATPRAMVVTLTPRGASCLLR